MTIYEVNKVLSSETKFRIIRHFCLCKCKNDCVSVLKDKFGLSQPNLSKHISALLKYEILKYKQIGKERYYSLNKKWLEEWNDLIMINLKFEPGKGKPCC